MSTEDEFNVAARYRTVRKHLDNLGYKHALTLDALPLIEKLLADLIQTTESLKHFKSIAQENIEAQAQLQLAVDPYKCDNVRLVQECNQLHLDLIKAKESHQKQIKDLKKEIYKLERECNDLQLASSRNLHRIRELEVESSKKSKKILELQGKCLKPTISNVGLASKKRPCYPLRRPVIESEPLPKVGGKATPLPSLSKVEPKVVDLISMADHKMNCLTHEVTKLKGELSIQSENVQTLKTQLATKEKEIMRLKKMLEGGRPYSAVSKDCVCKKVEDNFIMSGDSISINELKILQQEKLELEQQLKEALNKQHDAMSQALKLADRNEVLEKELRDIDHIALAVEADCNSAVKENNKRVSKLQQKLEDVMTQVHVLEGELNVERKVVQELRADLEACRLEKRNVQRNLEFSLDERKQMTDRINELTVIEKNLNDEIERLAKENEMQRQDIIQLQYSNKRIKEQMQTNEILQNHDATNLKEIKERGKKNDYNRGQNGIEVQGIYNERHVQNTNGIGYENIMKQLHENESQINNLEQTVEQLRRERDFYKNECNNAKDYHSKAIEKDHDDLWTRIRELTRQLSEKESALNELQREKKDLLREKTSLETRLQCNKNEHKISYRSCNVCKHGTLCNCSPPTTKDSSKTKGIIERLEHERNIARADVERLIEERDALRERLKIAAEAHTSEQRRLRENLTEVETRLKQIEKERQDLLLTQGARRATINGLEDQLQDLREELKRTKQELATQRTQYFQLRALQDQTDQALGDTQNQLAQSEAELNKALDRNRAMERQHVLLENQVKELQQEINNLKSNMTHLDHEKDQLLMMLDEKTERIAALEREIMVKEQHVMGSKEQILELQRKNEISIDQSADQERQLRSMQLELENLQRQLQTATYDRENAIQENQRVQDDLAAVTCEVRNLQRELEASRAESFDLKRQLQTYVSEVRRAEDLLNRKESERTEMLNHFRSLSLEATVLENNNHSLESEAAEARGALQSARDRVLDLERQLADRDSLIRGYETQISELTQNVASMETQLRQQGDQRHRAEADLNAVRDLCVKLDQQKDTLMQQLDDKDALKTQYDMQIAKLKAEQTIIQDQMHRDHATIERLEMLLDQARQESITLQANNQELQNEMSRLKQKMSELQDKLSSESAQLRQYQTQAAEYLTQINDLRRQMTNERFDRARKEEESRRHSEGPPLPRLPETPDSLLQIPISLPNKQPSNESNNTTRRLFQGLFNSELRSTSASVHDSSLTKEIKSAGQVDWLKKPYTAIPKFSRIFSPVQSSERNGEHAVVTENSKTKRVNSFAVPRSELSTNESNCRCSRYLKEVQRDFPCINIILRSDCKIRTSQYNHLQKRVTQNEKKPTLRNSEDINKRELEVSQVLPSDLSSRKYNQTARSIGNRFDSSQQVGTQDETKYDHSNVESPFNNISPIPHLSDPVFYRSIRTNETPNIDKTLTDPIKRKLTYTRDSEIGADQLAMLPKQTTNIANIDDTVETNIDTTKRRIGNMESYEAFSWKTVPLMKSENDMGKVNGGEKVSGRLKTNLSSKSDQVEETKADSTKIPQTDLKSSTKERTEAQKKLTFMETELKSKSTNTLHNFHSTATESLSRSPNHRPYKEQHSHIASRIAPYIDKSLIEGEEIQNTTCTNQLPRFCTCKSNHRRNKTSTNHAKGISDEITLEARQMEDFSGQKGIDVCTNTNCSSIDYSKLNMGREKTTANIKFMDTVTLDDNLESQKNFQYNTLEQKPISTVDTTLDTIDSIINGAKKLNDKIIVKNNFQNYQCRDIKCNTTDCNYRNAKSDVTTSNFDQSSLAASELTKPEFIRMLMEIKEHTKTLEEQLTIMNKNMKLKKKINEKFVSMSERSMDPLSHRKDTYTNKQRRDIITQEPEKENVCIQEPSENDITYVKCVQDKLVKSENNVHRQKVKDQDTMFEEIDKKKIYKEDIQENKNYKEEQRSKHYKESFTTFDTKSKADTNQQIDRKLVKCHNVNNSKKIRNQCVRSASSFTLDQSNFRPLTVSTPKKTSTLNDKESFHYISYCVQNISLSNENVQRNRAREAALNELVSYPLKRKEDRIDLINANGKQEHTSGQEKTIVMLFLTRGVNNKYLKSKYKKLEFTNFKPKCIINSCITCNQGLVKCKSSRRKLQIPTVFRQSKSMKCKIEKCVDANQTSGDHFVKQPTKDRKVSDLLTTVCTQSSNLYITTATSVSRVTFHKDYTAEQIATGTCILS